MRKSLKAGLLAAAITAASMVANAGGIPVYSALEMAQLVLNASQQATEAATALETAKDAISTARQIQDETRGLITGNDNLNAFLNNPELNKVLPLTDWKDVYKQSSDINSLRQRWGLMSDDSKVQQGFDQLITIADALERNYNATTERVHNAEALRDKLGEVQTPQQKEDLHLRYQQELLEQQNQQARLQNMQMLMAQKEKMENKQRVQSFRDYMSGKASRPEYQ